MERNARERISIPPIGATSLLTVFAVLCLTVFALLTLSDVRADARLADASLEAVEAYYAADTQAQELLARLRAGERPQGVTATPAQSEDGGSVLRCSYTCPLSEALELQVEVDLDGDSYQILRWQTVSTVPWEEDGTIHVWTPD